jgi:glutamate synthase domain-containing protein 2
MDIIHEMAISGRTIIEPMGTHMPIIDWKDILFRGAQLSPFVLEEIAHVSTTTVIGKNAAKPLVIKHPVYITHMSFGALSRELKISLSNGSAEVETAMCSGEGGILPESMDAAYKYIFEYVPNLYSVTTENLLNADAIEIKIGQGTKPGMGGHLPGNKVTEEIARVRNKPVGQDIISPSRLSGINTPEDLKGLVDTLRTLSEGRPIGIKIAAGRIESDLEMIAYAGADFVTIDGRGGGTGASPKLIKDSTTLPTVFALARARKYLDDHELDMDLVITGGLRVSSDFAKALAMGADAIAIGTAAMMATACQQYRICDNGKCPVGCATQDPELRQRLDSDKGALRLANYLRATLEDLKTFARICGKDDVHKLSLEDIFTVNSEIANYTNIDHA